MWYQAKISYPAVVGGKAKTLSESYLYEGVSFAEVDNHLPGLLNARMKNPDIDTLAKKKGVEVIFHAVQPDDHFYLVKVEMAGAEKVEKYEYLVPATDYGQAGERVDEYLKSSLMPYTITHVDRSPVLAVYHPHNVLWSGDWHNRMDRYYAEGRYEPSDTEGSPAQKKPKYPANPDQLSAFDDGVNDGGYAERRDALYREVEGTRLPYKD